MRKHFLGIGGQQHDFHMVFHTASHGRAWRADTRCGKLQRVNPPDDKASGPLNLHAGVGGARRCFVFGSHLLFKGSAAERALGTRAAG